MPTSATAMREQIMACVKNVGRLHGTTKNIGYTILVCGSSGVLVE